MLLSMSILSLPFDFLLDVLPTGVVKWNDLGSCRPDLSQVSTCFSLVPFFTSPRKGFLSTLLSLNELLSNAGADLSTVDTWVRWKSFLPEMSLSRREGSWALSNLSN